jgi:hypothetical protein
MYLWKCWRETRLFGIVFLGIAAAVMPLAAALTTGTQLLEEFGGPAFQFTLESLLAGTALWLGAIVALHGFDNRTVQFLFTKPRSRAYFVWAGWAVGAIELLVIGLVNLYAGWLTLSRFTSHALTDEVFGPQALQEHLDFFIVCLLIYSLTYACTAMLRNGLNGLAASIGIWGGYDLLVFLARWRWNIHLPFIYERMGSLPAGISNLLWTLVGLSFVFAGQFVVERSEV